MIFSTHSLTFRRLWYKEGRNRWSGESPVLAQCAPVGTRGVSAPRGRAGENRKQALVGHSQWETHRATLHLRRVQARWAHHQQPRQPARTVWVAQLSGGRSPYTPSVIRAGRSGSWRSPYAPAAGSCSDLRCRMSPAPVPAGSADRLQERPGSRTGRRDCSSTYHGFAYTHACVGLLRECDQ